MHKGETKFCTGRLTKSAKLDNYYLSFELSTFNAKKYNNNYMYPHDAVDIDKPVGS